MSDIKSFLTPEEQPVALLDCKQAFENLEKEEKLYLHFMNEASWAGARVVARQVSVESPAIFDIIVGIFSSESSMPAVEAKAKAAGVSDEAWTALLQYAAAFLGNMGNYVSFGDTKFIPRVEACDFEKVLNACDSDGHLAKIYKENNLSEKIWSLTRRERTLGLGAEGVSSYYSDEMGKEVLDIVQDFIQSRKTLAYNTRLFRVEDKESTYRLVVASGDKKESETFEHKGLTIILEYGDHAEEMAKVADYLEKAAEHAANDNQRQMLAAYVRHFRTGCIDEHKEAQRCWIRDSGPIVETNIGFIESYRDPYGVRGEFESFVAVVDKVMSKKFGELVDRAEYFVSKLPWDVAFEKDTFKRPDFTALTVCNFITSGLPAGINLPNYDDVQASDGFKNVSLSNVLSCKSSTKEITFLTEDDQEMFKELQGPAFEVQVALHELLGHGSGKLLHESEDGSVNFDKTLIHPVTEKPIHSWYKPGQNFDSQFLSLSSTMEECRAECVGMFLSPNAEVLNLFGHNAVEGEVHDITYTNWLIMVRAGLSALDFYSRDTKKWRQAHMQARYAILRVLLAAGEGLVTIEQTSDKVTVKLDRSKILSVGVPAIGDFLMKLNVYKATGDVETGTSMYKELTSVSDEFIVIAELVEAARQPRKVFVQTRTVLEGDDVKLVEYEADTSGIIKSFVERYA